MSEKHNGQGCDQELLFELAMGKLSQKQAEEVSAHLEICSECASIYEGLTELDEGLQDIKSVELDSRVKEDIWENLQETIERSSRKSEVKDAWNTILHSGVTYAAAAIIILMVAAVIIYNYMTPIGYSEAINGVEISTNASDKDIYFPVGAKTKFGARTKASILNADKDNGIIFLAKGSVKSKINKLEKNQKYEVHTEDAVFSVKGTAFEVTKNDPEKSEIVVMEGTVWVEPKGKNRKLMVLQAGESATVLGEQAYLHGIFDAGKDALNNSRFEEAESQFRHYLDSSREMDNSEVEYLLADTCLQLKNKNCAKQYFHKVSQTENKTRAQNAYAALVQLYSASNEEVMVKKTWQKYLKRFADGNFAEEALFYLAKDECNNKKGNYYGQFMKISKNDELKERLKTCCLKQGE